MNRRSFVKGTALLPAAYAGVSLLNESSAAAVEARPAAHSPLMAAHADQSPSDDITAKRIPRWRGFNLQGDFGYPGHPNNGAAYEECDFATMADWGFDFARFPLSY